MNKLMYGLLFLAFSSLGFSTSWTESEINDIFDLFYSAGAVAASEEVALYGVSSYDFGMDLLVLKDEERALIWFSAQSQVSPNLNYIFGKAWLEMEVGNLLLAMQTANDLLNRASGQLAEARAHYLLGVIHLKGGSVDYGYNELHRAKELYQALEKQGGVELCERLINPSSQNKSIYVTPGGDPPRDDGDS